MVDNRGNNMHQLKIREFPVKAVRIFYNIEYSISKQRRQFLALIGIFFAGILLLFLMATWLSASLVAGGVFARTETDVVGLNYVSFDPATLTSVISYWQSSQYALMDKIDYTLNTSVLIFGYYDRAANHYPWLFQLGLGPLAALTSMSIMLGTYMNLWLMSRKCDCTIGAAAKGTGAAGGAGGTAGGIFSMLMVAGCCGGTGAAFLLGSLPFIGFAFSNLFANISIFTILLTSVPSNLFLLGLIIFMANKIPIRLPKEGVKTAVSKPKVSVYLIASAVLITVFVMGAYFGVLQSDMIAKSGMTSGRFTLAMYITLPFSASLFLASAFIELRRIFVQDKAEVLQTVNSDPEPEIQKQEGCCKLPSNYVDQEDKKPDMELKKEKRSVKNLFRI